MERLQYEVRPTAFSRLHRYQLDDQAIEISERATGTGSEHAAIVRGPWRVPLANIQRIRLMYAPGRYQSNRFTCQVWLPAPAGRRTLVNLHFCGLGDFSDQSERYLPFVRALCQRVAAQNPQVEIHGGYSRLLYVAAVIVPSLLLLAIAAFAVIGWETVQRTPWLPLRLLLIASLVVVLLLVAARNRPRRLRGDALPDDLLPKIAVDRTALPHSDASSS